MTQTETPNNPTTTVDPERPLSPKQFCVAENISLSTYHKLKRMGLGPNETNIHGTTVRRIFPKDHRKWRADNEKWSKSEEAKRERQRRLECAKAAGQKAAKSPMHVSKTGKRKGRRK
jgi:hypothetical protein